MKYLGHLAKVDNQKGTPMANCKGEKPCENYFHGALTSSMKEDAKASAERYFRDANILSRVNNYIDHC